MGDTSGLIGTKGININVGINPTDIILLTAGIFVAVVLGGVVIKLLTKNL